MGIISEKYNKLLKKIKIMTKILLLAFFVIVINAQFLNKDSSSDNMQSEESLKDILDRIERLRKERGDLDNSNSASNLPNVDNIPTFPTDALCTFKTSEECTKSCSNQDLCVQCFISHADGLGYKCLKLTP